MSRLIASTLVLLLAAAGLRAGLLAVPDGYTPEKSWPVIVSLQDNPSPELAKAAGYFLIHSGGQAFQASQGIRDNLLAAASKYNIDPFRIYGTGFSRGGQEVLMQAWRHPDWFAAIAPVCSDLREKPDRNNRHLDVRHLVNVPTLMLHGEGDSFRDTGQIEFDLMKEAGCNVTWRTYPGGHGPDVPFRKDLKMLTAFFEKYRLDPNPRKVVHLVEAKSLSRAFWVDSTLVKEAPDIKAVFKVEVKDGNRIEVNVNEFIASLDLYLNDKLVDMTKPVKVVSGEKVLYEGRATEKVAVKIRDGEDYQRAPSKPLWEEILEARKKAQTASAPAATQPAGAAQK